MVSKAILELVGFLSGTYILLGKYYLPLETRSLSRSFYKMISGIAKVI